ncbi:hypothetical protein [Virgibacillus sp. CBA3643]|uniref:hypothetical protein n=1 Tax=Virgibacillus sp. CBA3643 TaxID=2942278 RepID=UPI0035A3BDEC
MELEIYEIPDSAEELFSEVEENEGSTSYRIINYCYDMSMDNNESLQHFVDTVDISSDYIEEDLGTQITLKHPNYNKRIVIDSGGLGDFFSHGFDCYWEED